MILHSSDDINRDRAVKMCSGGSLGSGGHRVRRSWMSGLNPYMGLYIGLICFCFILCTDHWFSTKGYFIPQRTLGNVCGEGYFGDRVPLETAEK